MQRSDEETMAPLLFSSPEPPQLQRSILRRWFLGTEFRLCFSRERESALNSVFVFIAKGLQGSATHFSSNKGLQRRNPFPRSSRTFPPLVQLAPLPPPCSPPTLPPSI
uniref:Uncharacterized protein n=1 Tax=Nelumbo nucifera TaxID=4432 RepID=A0A822Y5B3_NELNU|nr:TPA_asm: hypothetical protein HUJ06_029115 [Nelumbo nucifera]